MEHAWISGGCRIEKEEKYDLGLSEGESGNFGISVEEWSLYLAINGTESFQFLLLNWRHCIFVSSFSVLPPSVHHAYHASHHSDKQSTAHILQ